MLKQNIYFDNETIRQATELAKKWGMPSVRHISAVTSRAIERDYNAVFSGVDIEMLSKLDNAEFDLLLLTLNEKLIKIRDTAQSPMTVGKSEILAGLNEDIIRLENLIEKIKRVK